MIHKIPNGVFEGTDLITRNHIRGEKTYIIPLTFQDISVAAESITRMDYGGDIWELRVDLFSSSIQPLEKTNLPTMEYVKQQLELLQRLYELPILFTIRTYSQGDEFPDDASQEATALMIMAIDAGCQYIDVEIEWPASLIETIADSKADSKIVASFHDWSGNIRWSSETLKEKYSTANHFGDIIKVSILSKNIYDCHELALFVRNHLSSNEKRLLAVGMGPNGQLSRVTSPISLVTHEKMPCPSAPGQLTLAEVHRTIHLIGQLPKRDFFIFGNNIAHSLLPALHNVAFRELGLPHHYSIYQSEVVDESVRELIGQPNFGGASITFPHKLQIAKFLDSVSLCAQQIGAVNPVLVKENKAGSRLLIGDNADWIGIKSCIEVSGLHIPLNGTAVILGAGGAARAAVYTLQKLGVSEVFIVNRTRSRAEAIATDFPAMKFHMCTSLTELCQSGTPNVSIVIGCVPADDLTEKDVPDELYSGMKSGVLVEMAYRPQTTALMQVARRHEGWKVFGGVDVLKEQAYEQFALWTGRRAPKSVMVDAMAATIAKR